MRGSLCGYTATVSGRDFAVVAVVGLLLAAACLVLGAAFYSAVLAVAGALFVAAVLVAREGWLWAGDARGWLAAMAALVAVAAAAYAVSMAS
jgi:hypothetical protein